MRLDDIDESTNIIDERGSSPVGFGGGPRVAVGGVGGLVLVLLYVILGGNPADLVQSPRYSQPGPSAAQSQSSSLRNDEGKRFVAKVLKETEVVWTRLFAERGLTYEKPHLVLFSGEVQSACGMAGSAMGPFYCPRDSDVYIDLDFYRTLRDDLGAGGDFAQAYVVAHEVGHHVQDLLGITQKVDRARARMSETEANALSVRLELQADFFAGVWAHHASELHLNDQDIEEAIHAANQIGDDALQRKMRGRVVPDSFTHGTSEQRVKWFTKGYQTGDMAAGDTFNSQDL